MRRRAGRTVAAAMRRFSRLGYDRARGGTVSDAEVAVAMRATFEDLGATYVKFGQLIGSSPSVFGEAFSTEFRACLDTGPSVPFEEVHRRVELELGMPLERAFSRFEREPLAAASIAVVHRARTRAGRDVVVKVVRPDVEQVVAADLDLMEPLITLLSRGVGIGVAGTLLDAIAGLRVQLTEELDLRNEMRSMMHYRSLLGALDLPDIVVPEPLPELSGRTALTMEFLDGVAIDDLARIDELGFDLRPRLRQLLDAWFVTALRNGVFHGDVHAGNLLVMTDGRIGVLDWGIVGRLDPDAHRFFRRIIEATLGDETAWDDIADHISRTYAQGDTQALIGLDEEAFRGFVRSQLEPMLTKPFGEVSLAHVIQSPEANLADLRNEEARRAGVRETLAQWRDTRKRRRFTAGQGGIGSSFDRGMFLLGKQLLYFERYMKMYLPDRPLVADREFFETILADGPLIPTKADS